MEPGEQATAVADSAAHNAWVGGDSQPASTPSQEPATVAASPAPASAPSAPPPAAPAPQPSARERQQAWINKSAAPAAPAPGTQPTDTSTSTAAVAQAAAAAGQTVEEFLEAKHGDQIIKIPLAATIPIKRNGQTEYVPVKDYQADVSREVDYRRKTATLSAERQAFDTERRTHAAQVARDTALREQFEVDRKQYEEAIADPQKWELWQQHQEALRTNPIYKANWEAGREAGVLKAEIAAIRQSDEEQQVATIAQRITTAIETMATEFPGVDPVAVQQQYAQALSLGQADLNATSLRSFFQSEAQRAQAYAGPLAKEVEELKAQIAKLTSQQQSAEQHNTQTARALERDRKGRFTAPAGGAPLNPGAKQRPTPYTSAEATARKNAWINGG